MPAMINEQKTSKLTVTWKRTEERTEINEKSNVRDEETKRGQHGSENRQRSDISFK